MPLRPHRRRRPGQRPLLVCVAGMGDLRSGLDLPSVVLLATRHESRFATPCRSPHTGIAGEQPVEHTTPVPAPATCGLEPLSQRHTARRRIHTSVYTNDVSGDRFSDSQPGAVSQAQFSTTRTVSRRGLRPTTSSRGSATGSRRPAGSRRCWRTSRRGRPGQSTALSTRAGPRPRPVTGRGPGSFPDEHNSRGAGSLDSGSRAARVVTPAGDVEPGLTCDRRARPGHGRLTWRGRARRRRRPGPARTPRRNRAGRRRPRT